MRLLDLFSGIGGFSLAAQWVWGDDLEIVAFCEIDKYCQKVLAKNFPGVPIYGDITKLSGEAFKDIDLITGGFPCQDISVAGKGAGITGKRSGLWSEMHRLIGEIRPRYALIENVPMLTVRGGTRVISDLAEAGYNAEWQIVGADDVGAWHRRKRIWIVAYPQSERHRGRNSEERGIAQREVLKDKQSWSKMGSETEGCGQSRSEVFNSYNYGQSTSQISRKTQLRSKQSSEEQKQTSKPERPSTSKRKKEILAYTTSKRLKAFKNRTAIILPQARQELLCGSGDAEGVRPNWNYWDTEPDVGRVADGIPSRVDRLKGLGNAIVPQVAALIMDRIKAVA